MKQILVVEDETGIREALVEILERQDYLVQPARNGQDALDLLRATEKLPHLIILDMIMPVMDGKTLFGWLNQDPRTSSIPVLVVSGVEEGTQDFPKNCKSFRKPIPVKKLLSAVNELMKSKDSSNPV